MKQPFNLSQEKIDQIFRHCLFDLTPYFVSTHSMSYTIDNKIIDISWREGVIFGSHVTDNLFPEEFKHFVITITYNSETYSFIISDPDFEELERYKLKIYETQKEFYNNLLNSIPCELSSLESHPRIVNGE